MSTLNIPLITAEILLLILPFSFKEVHGSAYDEIALHAKLFENYSKYVIPRLNDSVPIRVSVECLLSDIMAFEESSNTLTWNALQSD